MWACNVCGAKDNWAKRTHCYQCGCHYSTKGSTMEGSGQGKGRSSRNMGTLNGEDAGPGGKKTEVALQQLDKLLRSLTGVIPNADQIATAIWKRHKPPSLRRRRM